MTVFSVVEDTEPIRLKPANAAPRWKRISTLSIAATAGIAATALVVFCLVIDGHGPDIPVGWIALATAFATISWAVVVGVLIHDAQAAREDRIVARATNAFQALLRQEIAALHTAMATRSAELGGRIDALAEGIDDYGQRCTTEASLAAYGNTGSSARTTPTLGVAPVRLIRQAANRD
jgi:hypothetical protein